MIEKASKEVRERVEEYFKKELPQYSVQAVIKESQHPVDDYLYMVIAVRKNPNQMRHYGFGDWCCWTTWNDSTQVLNGGHYDLDNYSEALNICTKYMI